MEGRATRRWITAWLAAGVCLSSAAPASAGTGEESCFTEKLNAERAAAGLASLRMDASLLETARRHSQRMAEAVDIFHNTNLAREAPGSWRSLGENVGVGPDCDLIHTALMKSPPHRKNILDSIFDSLGIGVIIGSDGGVYVTQVFMQSSREAPPSPPGPRDRPAHRHRRPARVTATGQAKGPVPAPPSPPEPRVEPQIAAYAGLLEKEATLAPEDPRAEPAKEPKIPARSKAGAGVRGSRGQGAATAQAFWKLPLKERSYALRVAAFLGQLLLLGR
ncbi:MAG: CAP domain-containing protein [Actinomycetota bacterium]